jgi:hypothetical protein
MDSTDIPQVADQGGVITNPQIEDAEGFLRFLFDDVARRPEKLNLTSAGKVVAYVLRLIAVGRPHDRGDGNESANQTLKQEALEMAGKILVCSVQHSEVQPYDKVRALSYLDKSLSVYLSHPYMESVRQLIRDFEIPPKAPKFEPPRLVSKSMSVSFPAKPPEGSPPRESNIPKELDDLSERIYIAYHLLRSHKNHRKLIAQALETAKVPHKTRTTLRGRNRLTTEWDTDEISDRSKKFESRFKRRLEIKDANALLRCRRTLLWEWVFHFQTFQVLQRELDSMRSNAIGN